MAPPSTSPGSSIRTAGRGAVREFYFDASNRRAPALERNYDRTALLAPRWENTTLCGREWAVMVAGDGGPFDELAGETACAPTCRRCLTVMYTFFPAPPVDQRLSLVASLVADSILEHGHAELSGVPGDQHDAVRKAVRTLVRQRTGQSCRSYVHDTMVLFDSDALYAEHAEENMQLAAQAIERALAGRSHTDPGTDMARVLADLERELNTRLRVIDRGSRPDNPAHNTAKSSHAPHPDQLVPDATGRHGRARIRCESVSDDGRAGRIMYARSPNARQPTTS